MLIRILITTVFQIFCKIILISKFIVKSIIDPDDNIWRRNINKNITNNSPSNFCKIILNSKVIIKSIIDADDNIRFSIIFFAR